MDKVIYLSGTTRGGTLEGITRSFAPVLEQMGFELLEISLRHPDRLLPTLRSLDLGSVKFILSGVSMGMDLTLDLNGQRLNLWKDLGIPYISLHGDSPAYFFDRHVVPASDFILLYAFAEHFALRKVLPLLHGPIGTLEPIVLDELPLEQVDRSAKACGTLLFLKNGKDPAALRRLWKSILAPRPLRALYELADQLEGHLNAAGADQIDRAVTLYFEQGGFDLQTWVKLRMFFIAQLDDYIRAVKSTRLVMTLMDLPVHIRGNNWEHVDFSGRRASYINDCNYVDSIGLIRGSLGLIDVSPNTSSLPHDRVMRAYGSHTVCLTNGGQSFLNGLPHQEELSYDFEDGSLASRAADLLAHKCDAVDMGIAVAEAFRKLHPPERAFQKMLDYAAFGRLDQLAQRPAGVQDFVVWPPQHLHSGSAVRTPGLLR